MILLTGGTGFVGRALARRLVADDWPVRVLSRAPGRVVFPEAVTGFTGDLRDPATLRPAMTGVDIVVHAGAALGARASAADLERVNAAGTAALASAAREAGVRQFIHVSSAGVYGDGATAAPHAESDTPSPQTPYEHSKLAAERALAAALNGSDVRWTILRPAGLYGAERPATAALVREVAGRDRWIHGPARVIVHPTHVDDLVTVVALVLGRTDLGGEVINVGGERALENADFIAMIGERLGKAPAQWRPPAWTAGAASVVARAWRVLGEPPAALARASRTWINRSVDIGKAQRLLGFEPLPLARGLDETLAMLRERDPMLAPARLSDTAARSS